MALLDLTALQQKPTATRQAPLAFEALKAVRALLGSVDQVHMYDDYNDGSSGVPVGHDITSCRLVPAVVQWRRSSHIITVIGVVSGMLGTAAAQESVVTLANRLIEALHEIEVQYRKQVREALPPVLIQLSACGHSLLEHEEAEIDLDPLADAISTATPPTPNVQALINTYPSHVKSPRLRALAFEQAAAKAALQALQSEINRVAVLSDEQCRQEAEHMSQLILRLEAATGRQCPRNGDGMPVAFLPATTFTWQILQLAARAWVRAAGEFDGPAIDEFGPVEWEDHTS